MTTTEASLASRIGRNLSGIELVSDEAALVKYELAGARPAAALLPQDAAQVAECVRFANAEKLAIVPCGACTKLSIGSPPSRFDVALDLSRMNRVLAYEPRDLTLGVEAGITFAALAPVLAKERQFLPLDPPFMDRATVGGILAADSVSPLRHRFGGPRDFVLGMEFVTGYGAQSKSGGRVVKNVTGYDLHKPLIGSLGTLAIITRVSFKTFPMPQTQAGFLLKTNSSANAHAFCRAIVDSPLEPAVLVSVAGDVVSDVVENRPSASPAKTGDWSVFALAAGSEAVVARHRRDLFSLAARVPSAQLGELSPELRAQVELRFREFPANASQTGASPTLFRISALPSNLPILIDTVSDAVRRAEIPAAILVHALGLIYLSLQPEAADSTDALAGVAESILTSAGSLGAAARIEFAPANLKRKLRVWGPRRDDFELMRRVKHTFDPQNVLSPGRFVEGL